MNEQKQLMEQYVSDMVALEKHIFEAVQRQSGQSTMEQHLKAGVVIRNIERVMNKHVEHLGQHHETSFDGGVVSSVKEGISAAAGVVAGLYNELRGSDNVSRMLRDDYTALSMAAISYTMLYTSALALNDEKTAGIALKHLDDITSLVVEISEIMPLVVAKELADSGLANGNVGERAAAATQRTWQ